MATSPDDEIHCVRAGIEMTKAQWFSLPDIRQRYWQETDWGKGGPASPELVDTIRMLLGKS